jgi:hypothetical protein
VLYASQSNNKRSSHLFWSSGFGLLRADSWLLGFCIFFYTVCRVVPCLILCTGGQNEQSSEENKDEGVYAFRIVRL